MLAQLFFQFYIHMSDNSMMKTDNNLIYVIIYYIYNQHYSFDAWVLSKSMNRQNAFES